MAENEGAPSEAAVEGGSIGFEDLTVDRMAALPPKRAMAQPDFVVTHFPISREEFRDRKGSALQAEGAAAREPAAAPEVLQEDPGGGVLSRAVAVGEAENADLGEDEVPDPTASAVLAPAVHHSFEVLPQTRFQPPDCALAVGPRHVLAAVNTSMAIYDKSGAMRQRWPDLTQFFQPVLPTGAGIFDPQVHYDHYADRWLLVIAARRQSPRGSWMLVAASQTEDPENRWWVWALDFSVDGSNRSENWADYPMLGVDSQAVYIGTNQFGFGGGFSYGKVRILNKQELYAGAALRWWDYWNLTEPNDSLAFTVHPCRHYRGVGNWPAWLLNAEFDVGDNLVLWRITDPIGHWSGGAPALARWEVPVHRYEIGPDALQRGGASRIETNDDRLLNAVYQSAASTQRVWSCHTVRVSWPGEDEARTGIRWYEVDVNTRQAVQQRTFGAPGRYYFFPAIQTDLRRNAYLVFSRSGQDEFGQLRTTGRLVNDPPNDLQGSDLVKAGESAYGGNRWGDYLAVSRDGADRDRVWGYGEFADASSAWGTWAFSAKF